MTISHRYILTATLYTLIGVGGAAQAEQSWSWSGTWKGSLGGDSQISMTVIDNKVVAYVFRGLPIKISYSDASATKLTFGDHDNYSMKLTKKDDSTVLAKYHGRRGYAIATLTRE